MDIFTYIRQDNNRLYDLIEDARETQDPALRKMLFVQISEDLLLQVEGKTLCFYRYVADHLSGDRPHLDRERACHYIEAVHLAGNETGWMSRFDALRLAFLAHVEHEERTLFAAARARFSEEQAAEILLELEAHRLQTRGSRGGSLAA
jgi:hypothetical protein